MQRDRQAATPAITAASQVSEMVRAASSRGTRFVPSDADHALVATAATPISSTTPNAIRPTRRAKI
ncbi:MAG: hypothetical protein E6J91_05350 [Deltaproteobacteria bacterium]|nr:MAG: hypothetical protein E6J91_05350 [Deltaproteobacteria bacterium]